MPEIAKDMAKDAAKDFESAFAELETLVKQLEGGKIRLNDAVAAYERGVALKTFCAEKLKEAQMRVETLNPAGLQAAELKEEKKP